ncbi:anti-anti-sigma regulatory factor [Vibrio galatheae]|uniref:Anti-anti-sigma regulatory factor n=1 Tax=Vibrio galatheae TaxID=579748 RepID=A0A0F4NFD3_9VIBR|nr:STAS domain-containing protein [Vibrio galatheae]KJY81827.1 anti-anti-sigma regulatory factor [Vibrio galatheae]
MECSLPESLDISTVLDSATQYKQWLANSDLLKIDASRVTRVDAAGIQALTSLFISAKSNQLDIQLIQPTPALLEGINTLGLSNQFDMNNEVGEP